MRSKLLLTYNIRLETQEEYMRFMVNILVPTLQRVGLANTGVWHTMYGNYPMRLITFVAENEETMRTALESKVWIELEEKLKGFVEDYTRRVVPYDPGFQF